MKNLKKSAVVSTKNQSHKCTFCTAKVPNISVADKNKQGNCIAIACLYSAKKNRFNPVLFCAVILNSTYNI